MFIHTSFRAANSTWRGTNGYTPLDEHDGTIGDNKDDAGEALSILLWGPGLVVLVIVGCVVTKLQFDMSILGTVFALLLAFFLSLVAIQATGATDATPLTAVSKVSQVLLGATTKGPTESAAKHSQKLNLLGGALVSIGASQACGKSPHPFTLGKVAWS